MHGQEMTNEIELGRTRYEVTTIDRSYPVYVAVWKAAVGEMLPCKQKGGNTHVPYAVALAENNDTIIDNDSLVLNENCG